MGPSRCIDNLASKKMMDLHRLDYIHPVVVGSFKKVVSNPFSLP